MSTKGGSDLDVSKNKKKKKEQFTFIHNDKKEKKKEEKQTKSKKTGVDAKLKSDTQQLKDKRKSQRKAAAVAEPESVDEDNPEILKEAKAVQHMRLVLEQFLLTHDRKRLLGTTWEYFDVDPASVIDAPLDGRDNLDALLDDISDSDDDNDDDDSRSKGNRADNNNNSNNSSNPKGDESGDIHASGTGTNSNAGATAETGGKLAVPHGRRSGGMTAAQRRSSGGSQMHLPSGRPSLRTSVGTMPGAQPLRVMAQRARRDRGGSSGTDHTAHGKSDEDAAVGAGSGGDGGGESGGGGTGVPPTAASGAEGAVEERGVVVVLHPGGTKPQVLFQQIVALALEGYRVLAPWFPCELSTPEDFVAGVEMIVRHEGVERAHFYGIGFGANIAHHYLLFYPHRVETITLSHAHPPDPEIAPLFAKYVRKKLEGVNPHFLVGYNVKVKDMDADVPGLSEAGKDVWVKLLRHFRESKKHLTARMEAMAMLHAKRHYRPSQFKQWIADGGRMLIIDTENGLLSSGARQALCVLHPKANFWLVRDRGPLHSLLRSKSHVRQVLRHIQNEPVNDAKLAKQIGAEMV